MTQLDVLLTRSEAPAVTEFKPCIADEAKEPTPLTTPLITVLKTPSKNEPVLSPRLKFDNPAIASIRF